MPDEPGLRRDARLDDRAAAAVDALDDATVGALEQAWAGAVSRQDEELQDAVDGALSLLPRVLRSRITKVLTGGGR